MTQRLAQNRRLQAKNAPRCKLLILFPSSAVRPGRTSRLLSCPPNWAIVSPCRRHKRLLGLIIAELAIARAAIRQASTLYDRETLTEHSSDAP